ncbi:uncharacterized protein LOC111251293 [Varroa destructor]|uniref:Uncharacterized protein n=1 Tax=Varroa destructor TaxID=109461 RepID=A0A7M7KAR7_VARDE|nr:uncharacterized protein LOC111251293 [Varroa destructor]
MNKPIVLPYRKKFNATDRILRFAVINFPPYVKRERQGNYVRLVGAQAEFLGCIESLSKYRISIVSDKDMSHGRKLPNGTFTGIMGMFQRNEIDGFLGPSTITAERFSTVGQGTCDIVDFRLLTFAPSKVIDPFNFAKAFQLDVWLSLAVPQFTESRTGHILLQLHVGNIFPYIPSR